MTLLIFAAMALVIYGLTSAKRSMPRSFGAIELPVPTGCRIAELVGESDVLALRLEGPIEQDCAQVLLVDPRSGRLRGRLTLPAVE